MSLLRKKCYPTKNIGVFTVDAFRSFERCFEVFLGISRYDFC